MPKRKQQGTDGDVKEEPGVLAPWQIPIITPDLPGSRKERFSAEETDLLVCEVKAREQKIYGNGSVPPKLPEVKQAWEEVAASVSSSSGITRTAAQCRKRYNDVRRRGKKLAAQRKQLLETGGGPSTKTEDVTSAEDITAFTLSDENIEGYGGIEVGFQAPLAEDPEAGPIKQEPEAVVEEDLMVEQPSTRSSGEKSQPRSRRGNIIRQEDHPFLELQQAGFNMLERELGGIMRSVRRVNTRLSRIEMLLRPLGRIADNLGRLAEAVEHFVAATPPLTTCSPPSTRSSMSTLPPDVPGPSRGQPRRGAPRLRTQGGRIPPV
ncbi:uncharacterized protein [Paramormyrops kingsleyae]|uniref:uncharacterized protein isoform X1 n=1 Tax=Paramormyrops kingsleyae TaxID=1676925 RepID=UPI000CD60AC8|nr:myb-related transcription factor, partner of profilin-like isoform X1 [Paramormyrops kingsleyae]